MKTVQRRTYLFPFAPVSTNHMYGIQPGGRTLYLLPAAADFKEEVKIRMAEQDQSDDKRLDVSVGRYSLSVWFIYTKDHYDEAQDTSNSIKLLEDAVFGYLGIDDKLNKRIQAECIRSNILPLPVQSYTEERVKVLQGSILVVVATNKAVADDSPLAARIRRVRLPERPKQRNRFRANVLSELVEWQAEHKVSRRGALRLLDQHRPRRSLLTDVKSDVTFYDDVDRHVRSMWDSIIGQNNSDKLSNTDDQERWFSWLNSKYVTGYLLRSEQTTRRMMQLAILERILKTKKNGLLGPKTRALVLAPTVGTWEHLLLSHGMKVDVFDPCQTRKQLRLRRLIDWNLRLRDCPRNSKMYDLVISPEADWHSGFETHLTAVLLPWLKPKGCLVLGGLWRRWDRPWVVERNGGKRLTADRLRAIVKKYGLVEQRYRFHPSKAGVVLLRFDAPK